MAAYVIKPYVVETAAGPHAAPASAESMRWFAPEWTMFPVAPRRCIVRNPLNDASAELSADEYAILTTCEGCRPLDRHEARALRKLSAPPEHRPLFRDVLERCARQGLLMPLADLVARFGAPSDSALPAPEIVVRSAGRPQLLQRLLASAARAQERTEAAYRWHMVDDSRSKEERLANRAAIESTPSLDITYHDLSRASLESDLIAAFPKLEVEIRSLLRAGRPDEYTCARPLHYVLLRFAGRRFLHLDDDVLIEPRRPPLLQGGVQTAFGTEAGFWYESFDAAFEACPELALDPFQAHARWLGRPLADAWRQAQADPGGHRVANIPASLGSRFAPTSRVIFTGTQVVGDPGWGTFASQQLAMAPETLQWLASHPEAAASAFESQIHWRGWPALHLAPQVILSMTTLSGIDNSVLIAPALRVGRATDTIVSEMTRTVHPAAWGAILPFALPHLRDARRKWLTPSEEYVIRPNRLLISYAQKRSPDIRTTDPAERLAALGTLFVHLGSASDATLTGLLEDQAADYVSRIVFGIHEQLDDPRVPPAWKKVLEPWLGSPLLKLDAHALKKHVVPLDALRALSRDYGATLIAWPRLWEHCRERFQA
jgi:hypothetical protein